MNCYVCESPIGARRWHVLELPSLLAQPKPLHPGLCHCDECWRSGAIEHVMCSVACADIWHAVQERWRERFELGILDACGACLYAGPH